MNLAKHFEKQIAHQLQNFKDTFVYRLSDLVNQFGVSNPCDYFVFHKNLYLMEMKTTAGSSLPLKNISEYQYESMLDASNIRGIRSYFLVWWYDRGITRAIPISVIKDIRETNKKSIRYDYEDDRIIDLKGIKKKLYFEYDWEDFFNEDKQRTSKRSRKKLTPARHDSTGDSTKVCRRTRRIYGEYKACTYRGSRRIKY